MKTAVRHIVLSEGMLRSAGWPEITSRTARFPLLQANTDGVGLSLESPASHRRARLNLAAAVVSAVVSMCVIEHSSVARSVRAFESGLASEPPGMEAEPAPALGDSHDDKLEFFDFQIPAESAFEMEVGRHEVMHVTQMAPQAGAKDGEYTISLASKQREPCRLVTMMKMDTKGVHNPHTSVDISLKPDLYKLYNSGPSLVSVTGYFALASEVTSENVPEGSIAPCAPARVKRALTEEGTSIAPPGAEKIARTEQVFSLPEIKTAVRFVQNWQLNELAQDALFKLDADTRYRVMQMFAPRDLTRGPSVAFVGFVKKYLPTNAQLAQGAALVDGNVTELKVEEFIAKWHLEVPAQKMLESLDPIIQQALMRAFSPRYVGTDGSVSHGFMSFAKTFRMPGSEAAAVPTQPAESVATAASPVPPPSVPPPVSPEPTPAEQTSMADSFAARWCLDPAARDLLWRLDPAFQQTVMREFSPRDVTKGASIVFNAFVKSKFNRECQQRSALSLPVPGLTASEGFASNEALIAAFIEKWHLNGVAQEVLLRLDPIAQRRIINAFNPKDTGRGASLAFLGFARSFS